MTNNSFKGYDLNGPKHPHVIGTFIQPGNFVNYTVEMWEKHFDYLLEVGIDIVILQWSSETPYYKFKSIYYPSQIVGDNTTEDFSSYPDFLDKLLKAAENKGILIFVGLNVSDEWWDIKIASQKEWYTKQGILGQQTAKEIYDLYKKKYPNAFHGWYFVWEMYNPMDGYEKQAAELLNLYLDYFTELDDSMPMMLSPFVSRNGTAEACEPQWTKIFADSNFREGDIFCCQDAVGAGWITIDMLDSYCSALKKAVDTKKGLEFWANNENFDIANHTYGEIERFVRQMEISSKYVKRHVTFAYSHYYSPDVVKTDKMHNDYKYYYETGKVKKD